jgi:hypothetical protein
MGVHIAALKRCATQDQQRPNRRVKSTAQNQQRKINRTKSTEQNQQGKIRSTKARAKVS